MKKAIGQTVRDLKREVNKKVLKVPGIEQKVLDSTSNEPWGPHGSLLADIAHASRNYHEYQMIMTVIWKRINDTGKNWRHVYKALTVLEYLVAHGSERVIDEIRERGYQISTLSDFQYIDSSGRDQGSNVRKKSQSLVVLVNDKERIIEVRQKAAANRDKFRNASSTGGMYKPSSNSGTGGYGDRYDDDRYEGRYGSRDDDRNGYGYGIEREGGYRDDDRYGRNGDSYSRDGDRYGRDFEESYRRDGCNDDDSRGRNQNIDDFQYGSRSRSSDRDRDHAVDDDGQYSSRDSGARAEETSQDRMRHDRKFSEQNLGAPPSYEEAVNESRSPVHSERNGETSAAPATGTSSPPQRNNQSQPTATPGTSFPENQEVEAFDEFDPRGSVSAISTTPNDAPPVSTNSALPPSNSTEMDLLGSLSESFSSNALAIMPATATATSEADGHADSGAGPAYQPFEDPFGDSPFKAIPSTDSALAQPQTFASTAPIQPAMNESSEQHQPGGQKVDAVTNFDFGDSLSGITYPTSNVSSVQPPTNSPFLPHELLTSQQDTDILADILPPSGPSQASFPALTGQTPQPGATMFGSFSPESESGGPVAHMAPQTQTGPAAQFSGGSYFQQGGSRGPISSHMPQNLTGPAGQHSSGNYIPQHAGHTVTSFMATPGGPATQYGSGNYFSQQGATAPVASQNTFHTPPGPAAQHNGDVLGNFLPQSGPNTHMPSQPALPSSTGSLAILTQPSKDKFETKSTVWADTLSRGLVNLNISGPKTNPLADIGVDFDAINRREKRMEKPVATPVTSTVTMGKAMGSGSGLGRAGASALRPPPNHMVGSGMGMAMGGNPGAGMGMGMGGTGSPGVAMGMGMGGYGGMNQPMGMGMGMNMGIGMNMGMGQGMPMQQPIGFPPGSTVPGAYNPAMGAGGYPPQQPYGGGYR